jgi:hypothetical protein
MVNPNAPAHPPDQGVAVWPMSPLWLNPSQRHSGMAETAVQRLFPDLDGRTMTTKLLHPMTRAECGAQGGRPRLKSLEELLRMQPPVPAAPEMTGGRLPGRLRDLRKLVISRYPECGGINRAAGEVESQPAAEEQETRC